MNCQQVTQQPPPTRWLQAPELDEFTAVFGSQLQRLHRDSLTRLIVTIAVAIEFDLTLSLAADESKIWDFTSDEAHQQFERAISILDSLPREYRTKLLMVVTRCLGDRSEA